MLSYPSKFLLTCLILSAINMTTNSYRTALITGASSGIGAEYARQLAVKGTKLILVARRKEKLKALAESLQKEFSISIDIFPADLSISEDVARVEEKLASVPDLDLLVNNAGFGAVNRFFEGDPRSHFDMLQVHVTASVHLTRSALLGMVARKSGWIVNVASVAAFFPYGSVLYPSTKAFLVSFSQALQAELQGTGIHVQALCPGFTYTEFHDVINMDRRIVPKFAWMSAERVVSTSLKALPHGRVIVVPGWQYRFIVALTHFPLISSVVQWVAASNIFKRRIIHDQHS
jgi:short-subunit dehydrogenase